MTTAIVNNPVRIEINGYYCGRGCPGRGGQPHTCRYFVDPDDDAAPVTDLRVHANGQTMRSAECLAAQSTEGK